MRDTFKAWFPLAIVLTVILGTVYVVAQQTLRLSANDPQIQLAEDWASQLNDGTNPTSLDLGKTVDPNHSLATFGIVYDQNGNIANASVAAPSTMLQPDGVLGAVDRSHDNEVRFTWQPESGARYAAVIKRATASDKTYYVLAARNLREVEHREDQMMLLTSAAWVAGLALTALSQQTHVAVRAMRKVTSRKK